MKKMFRLVIMLVILALFSTGFNAYAEDDEKLCEHHSKLFDALQKDAQSMGNGFQDLLSKKSDYGKMIFLIQASHCESFRKEHASELSTLQNAQKNVAEEIEKRNQISN